MRGARIAAPSRYSLGVRPLVAFLIVLCAIGCAGTPVPSSKAARTPTPKSVTRDNPGGDADNPTDAALERLLHEPVGYREDKFETLDVHLADWKNWKRIRFFGYPTRAGFRYGKDPAYAAGVVLYLEAEDDSPTSCIETVAKKAHAIADVFDVAVAPMERAMYQHERGTEAVDWPKWEQEWRRKEEARIAELQRERKARAKARAERLERLRERRKRAIEAARKRHEEAQKAKAASQADNAPATGDGTAAPDATAAPPDGEAVASRPRLPLTRVAPNPELLRRLEALRLRREAAAKARGEETDEQKRRRRARRGERAMVVRPAPIPPKLPKGDMPAILTSGHFETMLNRDRYLGALVAYESWPGTCLLQGFAVKVGSDEALAMKVRERWLTEIAPKLRWKSELRERPAIQNR